MSASATLPNPNDPLLLLDDVAFHYGDRSVLDGCRLQLERGERVGLVGANGSGKTTLLAVPVGLVRPRRGRVVVFGEPRTTERDFQAIRGRVGLLFQDSDDQLFCPTVEEDVAFGPLNLGATRDEARRIAADTLARLGLAGYERRVPYRLSGGEKRLAALATVLAMNPEVLLLDEPTAGLDEAAEQRVLEILLELPQAMLVVSHDRRFLERLTTRCVRLHHGRIEPLPAAASPRAAS